MGIIIPIATIALMLRYLIDTDASKGAKYIVGSLVGSSFIAPPYFPFGTYAAMLLQLGISIFIILFLKAFVPDK